MNVKSRKLQKELWWVFNQPIDPDRKISVVTCYLDESGTDNNLSVAVVGGIVIDMEQFACIDIDWRGALEKLSVNLEEPKLRWPFHMKDFGQNERLGHLRSEERRAIFTQLVRLIKSNNPISISCRFNADEYRSHFDGLSDFSMYGAAFLVVAMVNEKAALKSGYKDKIAYLLDSGNIHRDDVLAVKEFFESHPSSNMGPVSFESDAKIAALQVADMISYAARRQQSHGLRGGFEPLEELLLWDRHIDAVYNAEEMAKVAADLRAHLKLKKSNEANA